MIARPVTWHSQHKRIWLVDFEKFNTFIKTSMDIGYISGKVI